MNRLKAIETPLSGLYVIERNKIEDERGYLSRLFCMTELKSVGWDEPIEQVNFALTSKSGTIRGFHYQQTPHSEMKLVTCIRGEVWDVAIDLRPNSPTYLRWHGEVLSSNNLRALFIPKGFAHGFQTLSDDVQLLYCHSAAYEASADRGINPLDPNLAVNWPLSIINMSDKDRNHPYVDSSFQGVCL